MMTKKITLSGLIVFLFIINMIIMISDYKVICNYIGVVISSLLIVFILCAQHFSFERRNIIICVISFIIYYIITSLITGEIGKTIISVAYFNIEFLVLFFAIFLDKKEIVDAHFVRKADRIILFYFFLTWNLFCIISIYHYLKTPDLARLMAAYRSEYKNLIIGGGYPMAYGSVVLCTYLFYKLVNKDIPKKYMFFSVLEILLMITVVYLTNSFICLLTMTLGFIICFAKSTMRGTLFIFSVIFFCILAIIVYIYLEKILLFLLNHIQNDFIESRLQELYNEIVLDDTSFHLDKRASLYKMSINSFLNHPIFGVGYTYGNDSTLHRMNGIGSHSTLLDTLGQFGIIGSIPFYVIILYPIYRNHRNKENSLYLITFLIMLALNPSFSTFHLVLVVYLIIPIIARNLNYYKMEYNVL